MSGSKKSVLQSEQLRRSTGCLRFAHSLQNKRLPLLDVPHVAGQDFTVEWIDKHGLDKPVLITDKDGLGLSVPASDFSVSDVASVVGGSHRVNVIDVASQLELGSWPLSDWADYFENRTSAHKVLNLISLEITSTNLSQHVCGPRAVRSIDWIDNLWPEKLRSRNEFPQVQKYCLMSTANSYTDFHQDFGGTSVWYHVLWGKKIFYLIPPNLECLAAFEQWMCSTNQDEVFFGDMVPGSCFRFVLYPGQTFLIPAGWIHAVFTPEDSLVFGGNYLHSLGMIHQLQVYGLEARTHVTKKYRFPCFREMHWHALGALLRVVRFTLENESAEPKQDSDIDEQLDHEISVAMLGPFVWPQLPVLLKCCDTWLTSRILTSSEQEAAKDAAEASGFDSPEDMVAAFWDLLGRASQLSSIDLHAYRHKPTFDLLDARDIAFAVPHIQCSAVDEPAHEAAETKTEEGSIPPRNTLELETPDEESDENGTADEGEYPPPPPSPPRHVKHEETPSGGLKLTLSKSLLKGAKTKPATNAEPTPKLSLRLPREVAAPEPAKTVKSGVSTGGRYGTRGLRLTSKFLSAATDADVDNEDADGEGALVDNEEEDDEGQFYDREGGDDDDDSFNGSGAEDEEDAEDYLPSKKRKSAGGSGGGGGGGRAQPQKKSLTLRQKYMQQMMRR